MNNELKALMGKNERILYEGKSDLKCSIFEAICNPVLIIVIFWFLITSIFMIVPKNNINSMMFYDNYSPFYSSNGIFDSFELLFSIFRLIPFGFYMVIVVFKIIKFNNTYYIVSDKGAYMSGGFLAKTYKHKPFMELSRVYMKKGIFDQVFKVGDVLLANDALAYDYQSRRHYASENYFAIENIKDFEKVYSLVKSLQQDIYSDVMYPNDIRPQENHGYNTKYKG